MQMIKKIKQETASMAVYVLIVLLSFLLILSSIYFTISAVRKEQLITIMKTKQSYEKDNGDVENIYQKLAAKENILVTEDLILYYDAINNTGNGHSDTATIWKDLSVNGNDGTINGATVYSNYVSFDGQDDWVGIKEITDKNAIALEATIMLKSIQAGEVEIVCNYQSGGMGIQLVDGMPKMTIYIQDVGYENALSSEVLNTNEIYHIVGTYDGNTIKLYVNGKLKAETAITGTIKNATSNTIMVLAANPSGSKVAGNYANINICSVRIYERALTAAEVERNYIVDKARYDNLKTHTTENLILYYDAINNTGNGHSDAASIWKDLSVNGNDGTMNGATVYSNYVSLNGKSDWVGIKEITDKNAITIEATIMLKSIQAGEADIVCNYEAGGMGINLVDGKPRMEVYIQDVGYKYASLDEALNINEIYHILGTYDGNTIKLYINGELQGETAITGTIKNATRNTIMAIGTNPRGSAGQTSYANVDVCSVKIYERAITASEVERNYTVEKARYDNLKTYTTENLILYYDAINNTGNGHSSTATTWKDLSGSGNDGTINGATVYSNYISLDGADDWVGIKEIADKNVITLETTIMLKSIQSGSACILCNYEAGGIGIHLSNGKPVMQVYIQDVGYKTAASSEVLNTNEIYHILGTYDGNTIKLYINGELQVETAITGTIKNATSNTVMAIGTNPKGSAGQTGYANVNIYSTKIYERAITASEVEQNYTVDKIRYGI